MRIEIEIPKAFEEHFNQDKFEDSLHRLSTDAHLIAGNYEQETAIMLIKAFKESKPAYDTERVIEQLEKREIDSRNAQTAAGIGMRIANAHYHHGSANAFNKAIELVRKGGVE